MATITNLPHAAVLDRDMLIPIELFGQTMNVSLGQILAAQNTLLLTQYSADGENWHDQHSAATDRFMRISTDGGHTWGAVINLYDPDAQPQKGDDGRTLYTWMKFSDTSSPQTSADIYDTPRSSTTAIGWAYNKESAEESDNPGDYVWTRYKGADAKEVSKVQEYYAVSASSTAAPAEWIAVPQNPMPLMTESKPYLWTYERTTYDNGVYRDTSRRCIGRMGADGAAITKVEDFYHASSKALGVSRAGDSPWYTDAEDAEAEWGAEKPWLWNYEKRTWSDGHTDYVEPHKLARWASDGAAGRSSVTSTVFKASAGRPAAPTGGDYTSLVPEGWSDGIPEKNSDEDTIWMSTRLFTSDGKAPQAEDWTTPLPAASAGGTDVRFSSVASNPGNPTDNPENWSEDGGTETIWMAIRTRQMNAAGATAWGAWKVSRIKDEIAIDEGTGKWKINGEVLNNAIAVPKVSLGSDGYMIINGAKQTTRLIGATGPAGATGSPGAKGATGAKGDSAYTVVAYTHTGDKIRNGQGSTRIHVKVLKDGVVIEDSGTSPKQFTYTWVKYVDGARANWEGTSSPEKKGNPVTVTSSEINGSATFDCTVTME